MAKSKALVHVKKAELHARSAAPATEAEVIDQACDQIRSLLNDTVFRGTAEVGAYVLDTFFGGKSEEAESKHAFKQVTFRALTSRCDTPTLPVSRSWLQSAVRLAVREKSLAGNPAWDSLSTTHKLRLLTLHDDRKVLRLAEKVQEQELSSRALHALVAKEVDKQPKGVGGRPPKNAVLRALDGAVSSFSDSGAPLAFSKADLKALDADEAKSALQATRRLITKLQELATRLAERG